MRFAFVLFALVMSLAPASTAHAALVLDTATNPLNGTNGGEVGIAGATPNYYIGDAYTLVPGTTDITGIDLFVLNQTGQTFTDVLANIYFWGSVNTGAATPSNPVFGDELAEESTVIVGSDPSGDYYYGLYTGFGVQPGASPGFTFSSPVVIPSNTIGVTLNFQGSTNYGASFNNTQGLTSLLSVDAPASAGAIIGNGYYYAPDGETDGNFDSASDFHTNLASTNISAGFRLYGDVTEVPEPASLSFLCIGGVVLLGRRRQSVRF